MTGCQLPVASWLSAIVHGWFEAVVSALSVARYRFAFGDSSAFNLILLTENGSPECLNPWLSRLPLLFRRDKSVP